MFDNYHKEAQINKHRQYALDEIEHSKNRALRELFVQARRLTQQLGEYVAENKAIDNKLNVKLVKLESDMAIFMQNVEKYIADFEKREIPIDAELNPTSKNAVQNLVVAAAIQNILDLINDLPKPSEPSEPVQTVTVDDVLTANSKNPVTSAAIYAAIQAIGSGSETLIVDQTLTADSTNAVSAKAVNDAIGGLRFKVVDGILTITY